ncbi:xylulokinase [Moorella naiadis]|uniref:xylulokinase n=1 Tax=Moorella naiadis (nom. illeg.) TaxID=3093670 RepID=UPI003D9CA003
MPYLLGIDIGTSGTKAVLVEESGRVVASSYVEYPLSQPRPGWAEQEPEQWWQAVVAAVKGLWAKSGLDGREVAGVGLSGQMHGAVVLDAGYRVLRPAILWCDQRTGAECTWMYEKIGAEKLYQWTGNPALPGFTAPKLVWLKKHEAEVYKQICHILLPKDYIRFRLTEVLATEVSDASGTLLLDVARRRWSEEMLAALDISGEWLPPVYESPEVTGCINPEAAAATGLMAGTPVVGGGGDQAAGAVGTGIVEEGILSAALGTSGVVFAMTNRPIIQPGSTLHAFCHAVPGKWHLMGVMLAAGGSLQWFRNQLGDEEMREAAATGTDPYELLTARAAAVGPGAEGLLFLPYLLGERTPYPDPAARGGFIGLTMRHNKGHLVRAVLEGVAFGLRDSLELLQQAGVKTAEIRLSGGGARSPLWRQILANVFKYPVTTVNSTDGPAFGAALLAGVGAGIYSSVEAACRATIKVTSRAIPVAAEAKTYERLYTVYKSLYPLLRTTMHDLTGLA